jgi:hypothetical protein
MPMAQAVASSTRQAHDRRAIHWHLVIRMAHPLPTDPGASVPADASGIPR